MKAVISREYLKFATKGVLAIFDGSKLVTKVQTIELPDNGNQKNVSCIPEGKYEVIKIYSPSRGKCFHILNVKDRSEILIHIGNYVAGGKIDSQGCILPGESFVDINGDGLIDIAESTRAMQKLLKYLPDKFELHII